VSPIVHHPFVIPLPFWPHELTGFGLAVLLAFVIGQIVSQAELTRRGYQKEADAIPDLIAASVIGTLIGGKIYYAALVAKSWDALFDRAGLVFWGGFMGAVAACFLVITIRKLNFARFADVAGVAIAAGYSVGRTGCWAVGDDYGRPWNGPLAVQFPEGIPPSTAANMERVFGIPVEAGVSPDTVMAVHPTQLYETTLGFLMFLVLWRLRGHKNAEGWLFGLYLVLAGAERFFIEIFRAKDDRYVMGLTLAQVIALSLAIIGLIVMLVRRRQGGSGATAAAA
jgi:phosphatidylglycerol:prolipoprotein diacylglycerol transferase